MNKNEQIWGFQEIGGHRRYVRHVLFTGPKTQRVEAIMVYDYGQFSLLCATIRSSYCNSAGLNQ